MQITYPFHQTEISWLLLSICFTYTYMYMQITLHSADFAGDKNDTFDFPDQMLAFLGTLFTLTIKIF